jgi:hypothetical protein
MSSTDEKKPDPRRGGGCRVSWREVEMEDGKHVIIEWAYKDGTFDWYDYKHSDKASLDN